MAFTPKPHTGMMWINDKRTEDNNQPHLKGKLNLPEGDFWISGWKSPDKDGNFRLSLATTPVETADSADTKISVDKSSSIIDDDDIPF